MNRPLETNETPQPQPGRCQGYLCNGCGVPVPGMSYGMSVPIRFTNCGGNPEMCTYPTERHTDVEPNILSKIAVGILRDFERGRTACEPYAAPGEPVPWSVRDGGGP